MKPPPAQPGWEDRFHTTTFDWPSIWKLRPLYVSPRDSITWLKLKHRNLYVANRDQQSNNQKCLACDNGANEWEWESMRHLAECHSIRLSLWIPLLELMEKTGITIPQDEDDITLFLIFGMLNEKEICCREAAAVIALGWRVLYAEIIRCRADELWEDLDLDKALKRAHAMLESRLKAHGERWKRWFMRTRHTAKASIVPPKQRDKKLIQISPIAEYNIHDAVLKANERTQGPAIRRRHRRMHRQP